jgi:hypothetical protein
MPPGQGERKQGEQGTHGAPSDTSEAEQSTTSRGHLGFDRAGLLPIMRPSAALSLPGQRMFAPSCYRCSNLPQDNLSLVRLGSRFSVCFGCIFRVYLDTSKAEQAAISLLRERFVSEAWDLDGSVYKLKCVVNPTLLL